MISFDLCCGKGHRFEGWFSSSRDYDAQQAGGLVVCPVCDDGAVHKALSVPNIGRKGNQANVPVTVTPADEAPVSGEVVNTPILPTLMIEMMQKLALAQTEVLKNSEWVGREFAETARAIHYGESDDRIIHGETSPDEAEALAEEGISVAPLPFPFIPPEAKN
ncbi:MAG: DUF1178 family protein [Sphingorhabdus sp.]